MNYIKIKRGYLRRKVAHEFNLAALMAATSACKMELGEFYTSNKLSDDNRLFWQCYGAYLQANKHEHSLLRLQTYSKIYAKFNIKQLNRLKQTKSAYELISAEMKKNMDNSSKKKLLTWGELVDIAVGDLQMSIKDFYKSSLTEIMLKSMGKARQEEELMKRTRLLMWEIRSKYTKKRIKPADIFEMPSDKKPINQMDKQEFKRLVEKWN